MDLQILFGKRLKQIVKLEDFVLLYGEKGEKINELMDIFTEAKQAEKSLFACNEVLKFFRSKNYVKCKSLNELVQKQQLLILEILDKMLDIHSLEAYQVPQNSTLLPHVEEKSFDIGNKNSPCKIPLFKPAEQSIISLSDYVKSPYATKRMRPIALQFTDFEKTIIVEEFLRVPGYVIQNFIYFKNTC